MPCYEFKREDNGEIIEMLFSISKCPDEIICQDGVKAKKIVSMPNVKFFDANGSCNSNASKLNKEMTARNEAAGKRMRERWKSCKKK